MSFFRMPFSSASLIIHNAALSLREPNGLFPSSFAKYTKLPFDKDSNCTIGVFPTLFKISTSIMALIASLFHLFNFKFKNVFGFIQL